MGRHDYNRRDRFNTRYFRRVSCLNAIMNW